MSGSIGNSAKRKRRRNARGPRSGGEQVYHITGMRCAACELIVEKKLLKLENVRSVDASTPKQRVLVEYERRTPKVGELNELFEKDGYSFTLGPPARAASSRAASFSKVALAVILAVALVALLQKAGLSRLVTVDTRSSLLVFLLLGLVAGLSSCAALVGGMVLSMSRQWGELYAADDPFKKRIEPQILFNAGRLISFALFGGLLALVGGSLRLTPSLYAVLVMAISLAMIVLGLQMLGVRSLQRFQFTMPKSVTRYIADETHFKGRYMPFAMGALTFFVPCGFAITAQSFALLSGNPFHGGLIMLLFALGTLPILLAIGLSSVKFLEKPALASGFLKVAGALVLLFALFNVNNQLAVLDAPNLADLFSPARPPSSEAGADRFPEHGDGKQILNMEATAYGYNPNHLTVAAGVPVEWRIRDTGTSGCTNAIISKDLFDGQISLTPGRTSVKVFTARKPGRYRFSCWMGMATGYIDVTVPGESQPDRVRVDEGTEPDPGAALAGLIPERSLSRSRVARASSEGTQHPAAAERRGLSFSCYPVTPPARAAFIDPVR